jgi:hypothetical protein
MGSSRTITRLNTAVCDVLPSAGTPSGGLLVGTLCRELDLLSVASVAAAMRGGQAV